MRTIRRGDSGDEVRVWQRTIGMRVDGIFGKATEKATRTFQIGHGLPGDGVVGFNTWVAAGVIPLPPADPRPRWPAQADCDTFYGNPRRPSGAPGASGVWENANLVSFIPPWRMIDEDTRKPVTAITIHRKCLDSIGRVFARTWDFYGREQEAIEANHLHLFSGSYVFRNIRERDTLSMHSYGCAIDIAAGLNELGEPYDPKNGLPMAFVKLFEEENWTWGGRWTGRPDAMHFQAAYVSRNNVPVV